MQSERQELPRRRLLQALLLAAGGGLSPALRALVATPRQTAGPFYPDSLPADSDSDLTQVAGIGRPALGEITDLYGEVLDGDGRPVAGARVEIWQCDARAVYHHVRATAGRDADPGFQGFGTAPTDERGRYRFRTIRPVPYPGRTPHIHVAVLADGAARLVTQLYVAGEPRNEGDGLYRSLPDDARAAVTVEFAPAAADSGATYRAHFPIVLSSS